jgi:hypothetical protein
VFDVKHRHGFPQGLGGWVSVGEPSSRCRGPRHSGSNPARAAAYPVADRTLRIEVEEGGAVFGPLNGVRTALVVGAALAALVAALLGLWVVTAVLAVGIVAHGALWVWLYRSATRGDDPAT